MGKHSPFLEPASALSWRDPQSSFWWLLAIAAVCAAIALWRKRWGQSYLSSAFLTIQQVRLQALFACVVVVLVGTRLQEVWRNGKVRSKMASYSKRNGSNQTRSIQWANAAL